MLVRRLVRNYYEKNLKFDGIEKETFYSDVVKRAESINKEVIDYLYETIGFREQEGYTASKIGKVTENVCKGNTVIIDNKILAQCNIRSVENVGVLDGTYRTYVKLISTFFKDSDNLSIENDNGQVITLDSIMQKLRAEGLDKPVQRILKSKESKFCIKVFAPKWKKADVDQPVIMLNTIYYNEEISVKERNAIVARAFSDALFNTEELTVEAREQLIGLFQTDNVKLAEGKPILYLELIKLCLTINMPLDKLLKLGGFNYIDTAEQVKLLNCSILAHTPSSVTVIGKGSITPKDYIILKNEDFKSLYEKGVLKTLVWEQGVAKIVHGRKQPLFQALGKPAKNDLR